MTRRHQANGETWDVQLSREAPHPGVTSVIFRCTSNSSFGWRVVEVPSARYDHPSRLEDAPDEEIANLFARSQPFDYSHDPQAHPSAIKDATGR